MANENNTNSILRVYTAESDELLQKVMEQNGDTSTFTALRYPENRKSPAEQVKAADTLLSMLKDGHGWRIYTHSDHLVNRLIRRIVEDGLNAEETGLNNMVQFYYANETNGEMTVHEIEIDKDLGLLDHPEGFNDYFLGEQQAIVYAAIHKKRNSMQ